MASTATSSVPAWRKMQIPAPLQRLFDRFPLVTHEANDLPERSQHLTSSELPTLYVFSTDEDARLGLPSFNPTCLKWQTLLRLTNLRFRILPSTNHASPTGALPFLLPPRTSPTSSPAPVPADKLLAYARQHSDSSTPTPPPPPPPPPPQPQQQQQPQEQQQPDPLPLPLRSRAYLSLVTLHLRNAWLHALCLVDVDPLLLDRLYLAPASSSRAVQAVLRRQLRRAAANEIGSTAASVGAGAGAAAGRRSRSRSRSSGSSSSSSGGSAGVGASVDDDDDDEDEEEKKEGEEDEDGEDDGAYVYACARDALSALAGLLAESGTGWFFGRERPGEFDAAVFSYVHLMMEFFMDGVEDEGDDAGLQQPRRAERRVPLGRMVERAGTGELARHRQRMLEVAWPGWDGRRKG